MESERKLKENMIDDLKRSHQVAFDSASVSCIVCHCACV